MVYNNELSNFYERNDLGKRLASPLVAEREGLVRNRRAPSLVYQQARFSENGRLFDDLLSYAPGLNTTWADIQAVLEEEAAPDLRNVPGHIDPEARRLIERSRSAGWRTLRIGGKGEPAVLFHFDGTGRHAYERTLSLGLRERVVCDGKTLLHIYPDLGLAARRTVSRFHRAALASRLPWVLPPAEDLAHGVDVKLVNDRTVALVPHPLKKSGEDAEKPAKWYRIELEFGDEGSLAERRLVEMPERKVKWREVYDSEGGVRVVDGDRKELSRRSHKIEAAAAPELAPDVSKLVVLPVPLRHAQWMFRTLDLPANYPLGDRINIRAHHLNHEEAMLLLASALAHGEGRLAQLVYRRCFADFGDVRPGFFPLLAACGVDVAEEPAFQRLLAENPKEPLLRYLGLSGNFWYRSMQSRFPLYQGTTVAGQGTFFERLATFRDLYLRWRGVRPTTLRLPATADDERRTWAFIRANRRLPMAWALLSYVQDRTGTDNRARWLAMADVWQSLAGDDEGSPARYEQARCLFHGERRAEARKLFQELYARSLKDGGLPRIDSTFQIALLGNGKEEDLWGSLMRKTAATFVEKKQRPLAVFLAWQCNQLNERPLADNLLRIALHDLGDGEERLVTRLTAIDYLRQNDQLPKAQDMAEGLLKDDRYAKDADLWRLVSTLAGQRGLTARSIACLEQALDLEYPHLPDVIDLRAWRDDHRRLLQHYQSLAESAAMLKATPPAGLANKTVRIADRWRAHDPEAREACKLAAATLKVLDDRPLAWDYLTTALEVTAGNRSALVDIGDRLSREGDFDLADKAYVVAAESEPNNPLILWDRARLLRQAGKTDDADRLLKQIADGDWPTWYHGVRDRARWQVAK
jgi:tetratricopeptide (TPR) repeat protein